MSSGADCNFKEVTPGSWKYWLQDYPYGDTESGQTYGPFFSFISARAHLDRNHGNPGGYGITCLPAGQHVHEWEMTDVQVPMGVTVTMRIHSLGPDPDRTAIMALIRGLPDDSEAIKINQSYGYKRMMACVSCNTPQ